MDWDTDETFSSWSPHEQGANDSTSMSIPYQETGSALFTEGDSIADELGWDNNNNYTSVGSFINQIFIY